MRREKIRRTKRRCRRKVYIVTAVAPPRSSDERTKRRAWAWYATLRDARRACLCNDGDMLEYMYDYLVIERVPEGCGGSPQIEREWWFKATFDPTGETGPKVAPCEKPAVYRNSVGFGLG